MSLFGSKGVSARALATLSDRQQTIIAAVAKDISSTLAEWIAAQFLAGRSPDEVWKQLAAAREVDTGAAPGKWVVKLAYNGERVKRNDSLRHNTIGVVLFQHVTVDGMVNIMRSDRTTGDFMPGAFNGIIVEREQ